MCRVGDSVDDVHVVKSGTKVRYGRQCRSTGNLLEECPSLPGEKIVLPVVDTRCIHRQSAVHVWMPRADNDALPTGVRVRGRGARDPKFTGTGEVERDSALLTEGLEREGIGEAGCNPGHGEHTACL